MTPNLLTFLLVTGDEQFYCMGVYIPPTNTMGVEDLRAVWEAYPDGCISLILGDLNTNFGEPRDKQDEVICDLMMTSTLSMRQEDTHLSNHAGNRPGQGGPGSRRGKGRCTNRSRIISWCANGTAGDFGKEGSSGRDTMTRTTELLSRP